MAAVEGQRWIDPKRNLGRVAAGEAIDIVAYKKAQAEILKIQKGILEEPAYRMVKKDVLSGKIKEGDPEYSDYMAWEALVKSSNQIIGELQEIFLRAKT